MKKIKCFILLLVTVVFVSSSMYSYDIKTQAATYDDFNPFYIETDIPTYNHVKSVLLPQVFQTTPLEVWDLFLQEGIKFYVTQSSSKFDPVMDGGKYSGRTYGVTVNYNTSTKKISSVVTPIEIYINSNNTTADAFFHETGHAFDCIAGYITGYYKGDCTISNSNEWKSIFAKYVTTMVSFDYCASINMGDSVEGFAEAFRLYLVYPQQLQSSCPEVYTYIAKQIAKYTAYVPEVTYNTFDYVSYANEYPDVMQAFGLDKKALWQHYITCGKAEGRKKFRYVIPKR